MLGGLKVREVVPQVETTGQQKDTRRCWARLDNVGAAGGVDGVNGVGEGAVVVGGRPRLCGWEACISGRDLQAFILSVEKAFQDQIWAVIGGL
jgi:hypothetical protein